MKGSCAACGVSRKMKIGKGLYFHCVPTRPQYRACVDEWLKFLHLPPLSEWVDNEWKRITLCSLHFDENLYPPRYQEMVRVRLQDGAVPTKCPPTAPSQLALKFSSSLKLNQNSDFVKENLVRTSQAPNASGTTTKGESSDPLEMENSDVIDCPGYRNAERSSCVVCGVLEGSTAYQEECLQLFQFPCYKTNLNVLYMWLKFCDLAPICVDELQNKRLCSRHFEPEDYLPENRKSLKSCAVPHLYPPKTLASEGTRAAATELNREEDLRKDFLECGGNKILEDDVFQDSFYQDHDYLASEEHLRLTEYQEKLPGNAQVLDDLKNYLCRICGQMEPALSPIYETLSKNADLDMPLFEKIEMHLPLKVHADDKLPLRICLKCLDLLDRWHELYVTCVAADAVLQKTFGIEDSVVHSDRDLSRTVNRVQDHSDQCVTSNILVTNNETYSEISLSPVFETLNKNCRTYGKHQDEFVTEEQGPFQNTENFFKFKFCRLCCEHFDSPLEHRDHVKKCRQLSTLCEICGIELPHRKELIRHKYRKHLPKPVTNIEPKKCDKCPKCFPTIQRLKLHVKNVHERSPTPQYFCQLCCRVYCNDMYYEKHMKLHEEGKIKQLFDVSSLYKNENDEMYTCPVCKETFNDMLSLVIHLNSRKEIKCSKCRKKLFFERRLLLHKCKKWTCHFCSKSFNKSALCKNHERIHTGEKPYVCEICGGVFRASYLLKKHKASHNPVLYHCDYCNKSFKDKYRSKEHLNFHMGCTVSCQICSKSFSSKRGLYKHNRKFHNNASTHPI